MFSVLTTKTWPLNPPPTPTEPTLTDKRKIVAKIDLESATCDDIQHYLEYAELLRDAERFYEAEEHAQMALHLLNERLSNPEYKDPTYDKEETEEAHIIASMILSSIYARADKINESMLIIEKLILLVTDHEKLKSLLEPLLVQRALLSFLFGHTSLATKDLDHALLLREKRTGELDREILDIRHHILLLEENPEHIQKEFARPTT